MQWHAYYESNKTETAFDILELIKYLRLCHSINQSQKFYSSNVVISLKYYKYKSC